jgi:hypothetical protein
MRSSKCVACTTPLLHVQPMSSSGSFCVKETIGVVVGGVERCYCLFHFSMALV